MPARRAYSDDEVNAAVEALSEPAALEEAQRLVASNAPQIQRILNQALDASDWFGPAHQNEVLKAASTGDLEERLTRVRTLIADETRISMMIGVAVGLELAHRLNTTPEDR